MISLLYLKYTVGKAGSQLLINVPSTSNKIRKQDKAQYIFKFICANKVPFLLLIERKLRISYNLAISKTHKTKNNSDCFPGKLYRTFKKILILYKLFQKLEEKTVSAYFTRPV